jgi:hypothetical protein
MTTNGRLHFNCCEDNLFDGVSMLCQWHGDSLQSVFIGRPQFSQLRRRSTENPYVDTESTEIPSRLIGDQIQSKNRVVNPTCSLRNSDVVNYNLTQKIKSYQ